MSRAFPPRLSVAEALRCWLKTAAGAKPVEAPPARPESFVLTPT